MSLFSQPLSKVASTLGKGTSSQAARVGVRRALDAMTLGSLGGGAAVGAGLTVGRNVVQGRDTFDGVLGGAALGAAGRTAYRAAWQGRQFMNRASKLGELVKAGKQGSKEYRSLATHLRGDTMRARKPYFA